MLFHGVNGDEKWKSGEGHTAVALCVIQAILAYEWWGAGWEKITSGTFPSDLAPTLTKFASENPHAWFKAVLLGPVMENAVFFGHLIQWSELAVAIVLAISIVSSFVVRRGFVVRLGRILVIIALSIGMLLNASFFFAAGWLSPSTHGVNMIMFWTQAALVYAACAPLLARSKRSSV